MPTIMERIAKLETDISTLCMPVEACIRVIAKCREELRELSLRVDKMESKLAKRLSRLNEVDKSNE